MSEESEHSEKRKIYHAKSFARSAMACPGCHATLAVPVDECPRCGYTGHHAVSRFPFKAPVIERFIDPQGHLEESDRTKIDKSLSDLAKGFPQPRICFCIVDLPEVIDPREFGFWMMNASEVDGPEEEKLRPWTILLVIDDINGRVSVTSGYAIEPFLDEEEWAALIRKEREFFFARHYGSAALKFIMGAKAILTRSAQRIEKKLSSKNDKGRSGKKRSKRKSS